MDDILGSIAKKGPTINAETLRFAVELAFGSGILAGMARLIFDYGKQVNRLDTIEHTVDRLDKRQLRFEGKVNGLIEKLAILWERRVSASHSPRQLNETGKAILAETGIGNIVSDRFEQLVAQLKKAAPTNAYRAEQALIEIISN